VTDASFDRFTGPLDYPMFVLTVAGVDGHPSGCLIGFATQCSIAPPRFLACLSKANHTYRSSLGAGFAAVHLLTNESRELAVLFGTETGDEVDKFARCAWSTGPEGVPLLDRCPAWLVGRVDARLDLGDHEGLLLAPVAVGPGTGAVPLMLSAVEGLDAGHPAEDSGAAA
jgi:flavin reductase (DIM6/NTAB) family NADH-FMN oxidoreductase RutF